MSRLLLMALVGSPCLVHAQTATVFDAPNMCPVAEVAITLTSIKLPHRMSFATPVLRLRLSFIYSNVAGARLRMQQGREPTSVCL